MPRASQRDIKPSAVKNRGLGDVINTSPVQELSATLNNGQDTVFSVTLQNDKSFDVIGEVEFSLWQTSITAANLIPNGSAVDASQFQIIGPWNEWSQVDLSGGTVSSAMPDYAIVSKIYIRNISAGASTIIVGRARMRYITSADTVSVSSA